MNQESILIESLQTELEYEEKRYQKALSMKQPDEHILTIQKRIEYLKVTLEAVLERYNSNEKISN